MSTVSSLGADASSAAWTRARAGVGRFAEVVKLRIGLEIALTALAGAAVMPRSPGSGWRITSVALAVLVSACAAGAYNQYAERDIDVLMRRTRNRPFVTGALGAGQRWPWVIAAVLSAAVLVAGWATNVAAAAWVLLGALTYGVVYTVWLKRRTWLNIIVGGFAGTFALLAGAAAVDPRPTPEATMLGIALFFWTPPHFWSLALYHKADYAQAGIPMLPVLIGDRASAIVIAAHVVLVAVASIAAGALGLGPAYLAAAIAGSAWFLVAAVALVRQPNRGSALRCFRASLIQLTLLLLGAIVDGFVSARL